MEISCRELAIQKFDHDSKMEEPDKYMHVRKEMLIQTAWGGHIGEMHHAGPLGGSLRARLETWTLC